MARLLRDLFALAGTLIYKDLSLNNLHNSTVTGHPRTAVLTQTIFSLSHVKHYVFVAALLCACMEKHDCGFSHGKAGSQRRQEK